MATVTGQITVLRKDFEGKPAYSRRISWHPYENGAVNTSKWVGVYEPIIFAGGDPGLLDKTKILIHEAYEGGYILNGEPKRRLIIKEYEVADAPALDDSFMALDEAVPF